MSSKSAFTIEQPTIIAGYALAIAKALDHHGLDSGAILKAAGISQAVHNDPMVRLPTSQVTRLYALCVEATGDPYFGLTVARFIHVSNLHALGYALTASANLMDFCRRVERFFRVASHSATPSLVVGDQDVRLAFQLATDVSDQTQDAFSGFLVLAMRHLYGAEFRPRTAGFCHPCPADGPGPYEKLFRSEILFDQRDFYLVLDKAQLQRPLAGACAEIAQLHDQVANDYLARLEKNDVIAQVRRKIIECLPDGDCGRKRVADALNMSPASLQARLTQRNTNFQEILEETRKELACAYLRSAPRSITEVAFMVGFTDTSNFTRAFKRWTDQSPSEYRRGLDACESPAPKRRIRAQGW
ncbi:MAG: AraC family transcriptional regulator [Panacagrimonas sp.]